MKNVIVAMAAGMMALGGFADEAKPLLGGFHPDPSICRGADGAYYLVTSSFMWTPGLPVYRSEDFRTWTFVGHVLSDAHFAEMRGTADLRENDGIWAPTLRYARGRYWVVVSFHGTTTVNYLTSAEKIEGPWTEPVAVKGCPDEYGIDPSLYFDDDGSVWWQANRPLPDSERRWPNESFCYLQRIDLEKAELVGPRIDVTTGILPQAPWAEGPHLYKIGGRYVFLIAEGGTDEDHAACALAADRIEGPYTPLPENLLITRRGRDGETGLHCTGHMDLIPCGKNQFYAVFLGTRVYGADFRTLLGRETFACKAWWADGTIKLDDGNFIEGKVVGEPWASPSMPGPKVRFRRFGEICFDESVEVPAGKAAVLYRNVGGILAWTNDGPRTATFRLKSEDGMSVRAFRDGQPFGEPRPLLPLVDAGRKTRFNGPGVGIR